jgi:hypothetical protein
VGVGPARWGGANHAGEEGANHAPHGHDPLSHVLVPGQRVDVHVLAEEIGVLTEPCAEPVEIRQVVGHAAAPVVADGCRQLHRQPRHDRMLMQLRLEAM